MKSHRDLRGFLHGITCVLVATCFVACGSNDAPIKRDTETVPRVFGSVPEFSLTDQDGGSKKLADLDRKIWIGTFIFTRCGATCPAQTAGFAKLQSELGQRGHLGRVKLVSFTVDPEFDTPAVLKKYGETAGADFQNWSFLTGDRGDIWDLSKKGMKLPVESERDAATLVTHSPMFVLVDFDGQIRGYYDGLAPETHDKIVDDIEQILPLQTVDGPVPGDVRAPAWLADRAAAQLATASDLSVPHAFTFTDRLAASGITFKDEVVEDVKRRFKASHYDHGSGVSVADVDNDGLLDIYFVSQFGPNQLWRNLGDGKFEDITEAAGVAVAGEVAVGPSFADIDNDGDADLYVTRVRAPNRLFLNDGTGKFADVSEASGLDWVGHSSGSVFFDYDRDGLLDLLLTNVGKYTTEERDPSGFFVAYRSAFTGHLHEDRAEPNVLFRNLGDAKFENVNDKVGFNDVSWTGDATPIDGNDDGWPDLYLLNMQGHDEYYENQQGKGFVNKSREFFPVTSWGAMGVKVFDYNRDGRLDLYVTDMHTDMVSPLAVDEEKNKMPRNLPINALGTDGNHVLGNAFFRKDGPDTYTEVSDAVNAENYWPWGISVADLNADGYEDVFIAASMSYPYRYAINSVLLNDRGERFVDSEFILGVEPRSKGTAQYWMHVDIAGEDNGMRFFENYDSKVDVWSAIGTRSSVVFDIEGDGDLDIVTNDFGGTPMVLTSNLQEQGLRYLQVSLVGTSSNRDGLGAMVTLHTADGKQLCCHDGKSGYLSQSRAPLYFGLGDAESVDRIEIRWPSGATQTVAGPIDPNQMLTITEKGDATP